MYHGPPAAAAPAPGAPQPQPQQPPAPSGNQDDLDIPPFLRYRQR